MTQLRKAKSAVKSGKKPKPAKAVAVKPELPEPTNWQRAAFKPALEKQEGFKEPATLKSDGHVVGTPHTDAVGWSAMVSSALGSRSNDWALEAVNWITNAGAWSRPGARP